MATSQPTVDWLRSRHCETGMCVEVAIVGSQVAIRDSNNPDGPTLIFTLEEWRAFTAGIRDFEFEV